SIAPGDRESRPGKLKTSTNCRYGSCRRKVLAIFHSRRQQSPLRSYATKHQSPGHAWFNVEQNRGQGKCSLSRRGSYSPASSVCVSLEPKLPRSQSRFETWSRPARKPRADENSFSLPLASR